MRDLEGWKRLAASLPWGLIGMLALVAGVERFLALNEHQVVSGESAGKLGAVGPGVDSAAVRNRADPVLWRQHDQVRGRASGSPGADRSSRLESCAFRGAAGGKLLSASPGA